MPACDLCPESGEPPRIAHERVCTHGGEQQEKQGALSAKEPCDSDLADAATDGT